MIQYLEQLNQLQLKTGVHVYVHVGWNYRRRTSKSTSMR